MRWHQLFSLVLILGLIGCQKKAALDVAGPEDKDVGAVSYNPGNEMDKAYGIRGESDSSGARGVLDSTTATYDTVLAQILNYYANNPYVGAVYGVTLRSTAFNNYFMDSCTTNPYSSSCNMGGYQSWCYLAPGLCSSPSVQTATEVNLSVTSAGSLPYQAIVYYTGAAYQGSYSNQSRVTEARPYYWQNPSAIKALVYPGSVVTIYTVVPPGTTTLNATMRVKAQGAAESTARSGSLNVSNIITSNSPYGWAATWVTPNVLTVTGADANSSIDATFKGAKRSSQRVCIATGCLEVAQ